MAVVLRLLVLILASWLVGPLAAGAQPAAIPRVGYLGNGSPPGGKPREAFVQGLRERGWIEGQTVTIEYRWAEGNPERLPALVAELVRARVAVIALSGTPAIRTARAATSTVPLVFVSLADPIQLGFVASLARPGGNATGLASQFEELVTKQLELLKETVPRLSRVAVLHHTQTAPAVVSEAETAASRLGLKARTLRVAGAAEFESVLGTARSESMEAIHVMPSPFFNANRRRLIELAAKHRLPAVYEFKDFVEDGGLMSYGPNMTEMFRGLAGYVDRILRGARPGDLPVERATKFELALNLKTARALGLTIPQSVLARADDVLQ
jgi:putative ABC transport system substrate-binding protein